MSIQIFIPGKPVAKARPRLGRWRAYTPKATVDYERLIGLSANREMRGREPLSGGVCVAVAVAVATPASWPKRKREAALRGEVQVTSTPDLDNYLKIALDGLNGIVWHDDKQVTEIAATKRYSDREGMHITCYSADGISFGAGAAAMPVCQPGGQEAD